MIRIVGLEVVWCGACSVAGKGCSWIIVVAGGWVEGWSCFVGLGMETVVLEHDCVEAIVVVGGVFDGSFGAIGFDETVTTFNDATVAFFRLAFDIAGMFILDVVGEMVFRVGFVVDSFVVFVQLSDGVGERKGQQGAAY